MEKWGKCLKISLIGMAASITVEISLSIIEETLGCISEAILMGFANTFLKEFLKNSMEVIWNAARVFINCPSAIAFFRSKLV